MASSINPNNIDTAYPVAGQDNDSQGFRDNFTNIVTALDAAKDEISEIHDRALFKSAISGTTLENDMDGNPLIAPTLVAPRLSMLDLGAVSTGTIDFDISVGSYFKITVEDDVDFNFINIPPAGEQISFYIEIRVPAGNPAGDVNIDLPGVGADYRVGAGVKYFNDSVLTLVPGGYYLYKLNTTDQGNAWFLTDEVRDDVLEIRTGLPAVGRPGDKIGQTLLYDNTMWVCVGNYDGSTVIWRRVSITGDSPRLVAPPATNLGALGDLSGDIAFDVNYVYTCIADYDGSTQIWARVASSTSW